MSSWRRVGVLVNGTGWILLPILTPLTLMFVALGLYRYETLILREGSPKRHRHRASPARPAVGAGALAAAVAAYGDSITAPAAMQRSAGSGGVERGSALVELLSQPSSVTELTGDRVQPVR